MPDEHAPLSKSELVMNYVHLNGPVAIFDMGEDDRDEMPQRLRIPRRAWWDMGSPEKITVTIVPGDLLN